MLYDVLNSYKAFLETKYTAETVKKYLNRLEILLQGQNLNFTAENIDISKVLNKLAEIKYKNHFSQSKNAFLHFCKFLKFTLTDDDLKQIEKLESATKKKYRKLKTLNFKDVEKKIKGLKNQKLKYGYQVMFATGLRVSELSQITCDDCLITEAEITFCFIGKGGKAETTKLSKNEHSKLYINLVDMIANLKTSQKVFYSAIYMQTNAKKLGFTCHDLRRFCAKMEYKKFRSKAKVKDKLRHSSIKNTNIYLRNKLKI